MKEEASTLTAPVVVGEFRTRPPTYGGDDSRIEFYMKEGMKRTYVKDCDYVANID